MDRMQRGVEAASRSARKFMRVNLSFAASHSYASPFFKRSTPRTDGIHSSVPDDAEKNLRRAEENVRPQFLSEENVRPLFLSAHADFRAQDHSDLVGTGNSGSGFVTASPVYHDTLLLSTSLAKFEPPRDLGVMKLEAIDDPQAFNIALQIMGSRFSVNNSSHSDISANNSTLSGVSEVNSRVSVNRSRFSVNNSSHSDTSANNSTLSGVSEVNSRVSVNRFSPSDFSANHSELAGVADVGSQVRYTSNSQKSANASDRADVLDVESRFSDTSKFSVDHHSPPVISRNFEVGSSTRLGYSRYRQLENTATDLKAARPQLIQESARQIGAASPTLSRGNTADLEKLDISAILNSDPLNAHRVVTVTDNGSYTITATNIPEGARLVEDSFHTHGALAFATPTISSVPPFPSRGRGRGGARSVHFLARNPLSNPGSTVNQSAHTNGLGFQWPSRSTSGGIMPTNLFGDDDDAHSKMSRDLDADRMRGAIEQFRDFIRQYPDDQADRRCRALLIAFSRSQGGSQLAMWVNSNNMFVRVKVMGIVDFLTASPRVRIHVRLDEYESVTFDKLYRDTPEIQYKIYNQMPKDRLPLTMADELHKFMQVVDDEMRETRPPIPTEGGDGRSGDAPPDDEPPGGDGTESFGGSQFSNSSSRHRFPGPPPHIRFDPKKIDPFKGLCQIAPREQYTKRAEPWLRHMLQTLKAQNIPPERYVSCALLCVDGISVAKRYSDEEMKEVGYPVHWSFDEREFPPRPESLKFLHFARWLIRTFTDEAVTEEQRRKFESLKQRQGQSVYEFNDEFNYEKQLLFELNLATYLHDDHAILNMSRDGQEVKLPWMIVEDARDVLRYISALLEPVHSSVSTWHTTQSVTRRLEETVGTGIDLSLSKVQHAALTFERVERLKSSFPRNSLARSSNDGQRSFLALTNGSSGNSGHPRTRLRLLHNQIAEVEAHEDPALETEHLYQKMHKAGTVKWSRAQLQKLFKEDRCFKCAQKGHRAPECRNPPVDPTSHQFTNLVSDDVVSLENDMELLHALYEIEEEHGHPNGGASQ